jgi:hypothetical protein
MPLWGNTDTTGNSAIYAPAQVHRAPTAAERDKLYGNTTANGYGTSETVGQFGVSIDEQRAKRADRLPKPPHAGWVLKQTGSGGRAGRVKYETLVAMGSIAPGGTGDEDVSFPDYSIQVTVNPLSQTVNATSTTANVATVTTDAVTVPSGGAYAVQWQANDSASTFADVSAGAIYHTVTAKSCAIYANQAGFATGTRVRAKFTLAGATTKYSAEATITKTT